jgi:hypothetical protein
MPFADAEKPRGGGSAAGLRVDARRRRPGYWFRRGRAVGGSRLLSRM